MCMRSPKAPAPTPTPATAVKPAESARPMDIGDAGLDSDVISRKKRGKKKLRQDLKSMSGSVNVASKGTGLNINKG